jgi:pimeloyl-ACP methyl ester carboxylesterase
MQNEWPTNLQRNFQFAFESVKTLDIPKEQLKKVTQPVLTIHGTKDRNAVYGAGREWAMMLPNARLLTVKEAAHQVFAEYPEVVFSATRTFLNGSWPKTAEKVTTLVPIN